MGLGSVFTEPHLLQAHLLDLLLEFAVLRAHSAKIDVIVKDVSAAVADPHQGALERGECTHRPDANQPGVLGIAAPLHLHRQPQHL